MLINVRPFRPGSSDEARARALLREAVFSSVFAYFWRMAVREATAQIVLLLAAAIFVGFGYPIQYTALSVPITLFLVFVLVVIGHWNKFRKLERELDETIRKLASPKVGFWIAEEVEKDRGRRRRFGRKKGLEYILDENYPKANSKKALLAMVVVEPKRDPDMQEPPESVGWIKRLAVSKALRRRGMADFIVDEALKHCVRHFRAVETSTSQCHESARSLFVRKGFDVLQSYHSNVFPLTSAKKYRLRMPCILKRSLLDD